MHLHCYSWTGAGDDRRNEAERRPPPPSGDLGPFLASPLPPMRTCDWLLKPRNRIDVSPGSVGEALEWLTTRYRVAEPQFLRPDDEARIGLGLRLESAGESLVTGVDVQWGMWLHGGRFVTCAVVCCSPNRDADYRCPVS
ncbi:hypothetical protein IL992_22280 [Microbispora sp. NEAU-D428]|uniref:hypothetical protein n=1 Tax=Microbispora sitophila TaxID=2771537 RepID=UPI001868A4F1|nr:hypothetical protein [Microbispora sitophila]MBE3011905.1 hypothetical protein [Microbispora sitophila]